MVFVGTKQNDPSRRYFVQWVLSSLEVEFTALLPAGVFVTSFLEKAFSKSLFQNLSKALLFETHLVRPSSVIGWSRLVLAASSSTSPRSPLYPRLLAFAHPFSRRPIDPSFALFIYCTGYQLLCDCLPLANTYILFTYNIFFET